jgi:hypothetical protein
VRGGQLRSARPHWAGDQPCCPASAGHRQVDAIRIPVGGVGVAVTVLLNRSGRSDSTPEGRVVMSVNVMIGTVLILLMITLLSAFALETAACSVGVPSCD